MISDKLENSHIYGLGKRFDIAFDYLKNTNLHNLPTGKYEILGTDVFAMINEYETKDSELIKWEAHRTYADIQVVILGRETIGFSGLEQMSEIDKYDLEKDLIFFNGSGNYLIVKPEHFVVFFPHDAHKPGIKVDQPQKIKKIVVKVRV